MRLSISQTLEFGLDLCCFTKQDIVTAGLIRYRAVRMTVPRVQDESVLSCTVE